MSTQMIVETTQTDKSSGQVQPLRAAGAMSAKQKLALFQAELRNGRSVTEEEVSRYQQLLAAVIEESRAPRTENPAWRRYVTRYNAMYHSDSRFRFNDEKIISRLGPEPPRWLDDDEIAHEALQAEVDDAYKNVMPRYQ